MGRIHVQNVLNEQISSFLYVIAAKNVPKAEMTKLTDHQSRHALSAYKVRVKITECRVLGGPRSFTSV